MENRKHKVSINTSLRKDLHAFFDAGYIIVTPEYRIEVSHRIREEFENGRDYYRHHGNLMRMPEGQANRPDLAYLSWHNEHVFRG